MAYNSLARAGAALAMVAVVVAVHGEGSDRPSVQRELAKTRAALAQARAALSPEGRASGALPAWQASPVAGAAKAPPNSLPNGCPTTVEEWSTWRTRAVKFLLQMRRPSDTDTTQTYLDPSDVATRSSQILVALDACKTLQIEPPENLVRNLRRFVETQGNANYNVPNPQHQLGHGVTDDEYLCRAKAALELPCLLRSQEFLSAMASPSTYGHALELVNAQNQGRPIAECVGDPTASGVQEWKTILYRSRFLTTPDPAGALGRFLIVVPAAPAATASAPPGHDRWIQFGIWTPEDKPPVTDIRIRNVSVVAVSKGGANSFDAMIDWFRCQGDDCADLREETASTLARGGCLATPTTGLGRLPTATVPVPIDLRYRLTVTGEAEDCQACHKMVPLSIHPQLEVVDGAMSLSVYDVVGGTMVKLPAPEADAKVKALNDRIQADYKRPPWWRIGPDDKYGDPMDYGAYPFGPKPQSYGLSERTDDYLRACAAPLQLQKDDLDPLRSAMNCGGCHSGRAPGVGILNFPQATEKRAVIEMVSGPNSASNRNLIKAHIDSGVMPRARTGQPPVVLTQPVRDALYRCLSNEYFDPDKMSGLFIDWLLADGDTSPAGAKSLALKARPHLVVPQTLIAATKPAAKIQGSQHPRFAAAIGGGDPGSTFTKNCSECHSTKAGEQWDGPSLFGVVGRKLADTSFPDYSNALRDLGKDKDMAWDKALLMEFLMDQDAFLTKYGGTAAQSAMDLRYPDSGMRQILVDYLATLK